MKEVLARAKIDRYEFAIKFWFEIYPYVTYVTKLQITSSRIADVLNIELSQNVSILIYQSRTVPEVWTIFMINTKWLNFFYDFRKCSIISEFGESAASSKTIFILGARKKTFLMRKHFTICLWWRHKIIFVAPSLMI